jgi:hypothetical protein
MFSRFVQQRAFATAKPAASYGKYFVFGAGLFASASAFAYSQQQQLQCEKKPLAGIKGTPSERTFIAVKVTLHPN